LDLFLFLNQLVIIFVMLDATVLTRYCFFFLLLLFLLHVFLSYVLSLICEAVLCLELVFAELGQAYINKIKKILLETPHEDMA